MELSDEMKREIEAQQKEAERMAAEQQAAAQRMVEEKTKDMKKTVAKSMAMGVLMTVGTKLLSFILGRIKK